MHKPEHLSVVRYSWYPCTFLVHFLKVRLLPTIIWQCYAHITSKTLVFMFWKPDLIWRHLLFWDLHLYTVVNIRSGSKMFIKVVLRQERILVLGQLWWQVLIPFKCLLVYVTWDQCFELKRGMSPWISKHASYTTIVNKPCVVIVQQPFANGTKLLSTLGFRAGMCDWTRLAYWHNFILSYWLG